MIFAVVLGGAASVWAELEQAKGYRTPDMVVGVNHAGRDYAGHVDHWASYHADLLAHWAAQRAKAGRRPAGHYWTAIYRGQKPRRLAMPFQFVDAAGGSSGLLGAHVALVAGADRVALCGVPMERQGRHFDRPGEWDEAEKYRHAWIDALPDMKDKVRSLGGWTRELLGAPTEEWLA